MLFVVNEVISTAVRNGTCTLQTCGALELLGLALFEGKHRVTASRDGLLHISNYSALSSKARAAFREALNDYQADRALLSFVGLFAHITTDVSEITVAVIDNKHRIDIPPAWIDDSAKIQATCLVAENLIDGEFLRRVGGVARAKGLLCNCVIKFDIANGGGHTCAQVIEEFFNRQRFCCCVVDSDKSYPNGSLGTTASAVQKFKDYSKYPYVGVTETLGRELENMIHCGFYTFRYSQDINHFSGVTILNHADTIGDKELRIYYDIKQGLILSDIDKHAPGSPCRAFWESKLRLLEPPLRQRFTRFNCTERPTCKTNGCTCRISNGFGNKVLHSFIIYVDQLGASAVASEIGSQIADEWFRIGRFLLDWGCARDRIRT